MTVPSAVLDREREFAAAFRLAALRGVLLDPVQVEKLYDEHETARKAARERVEAATEGQVTNPKSSDQVSVFLAATGRYELPMTGGGKPSTAKGALEPYAYLGDELCKDILAYRHAVTAQTLLLEPRRLLCARGDGRVRTTILTLAANTGRTSSRDENLQQVSRQGGMRACHRAGEGCLIVSADLASVEIRTGAALSGDSGMQEMIRLGDLYPERKKEFDFHWRTAITVWGPEATKENRYTAKRVNFCVPEEGTEILTKRGWLRHDQVRAGDQTIGYNFVTGLSEWTLVQEVEHFGEADVVRLGNKHKSWSPVVTPNHRWITERRAGPDRKARKREWTETANLRTEHSVVLAARALTRQTVPVTPAEAALIAWVYCDGHVQQSPLTGKTAQGADGRRRKLIVSVAQAKPAGITALERVLRECGAPYTMDCIPAVNDRCLPQRIYRLKTAYARELWQRAGLAEADKAQPGFYLTPFVTGLGPDARDAFLRAVIDAEGWQDGKTGGTRISQNEGPVCDAIILAATLSGWYVRQNRYRHSRGNAVHVTMALSEPRVTGQRRTTEPAGRERVWCVTTKLGSWMMRQHGQVMLTGNSKMYGSAIKGCAASVGIPLDAAEKVFRAFDTLAPGYTAWDQEMRNFARKGGKSYRTYSGREVYLSGKGEHAAGNAAIQGTAREFLVDGVLRWRQGPWRDCVLIPVHDELIAFDVKEEEAEDATAYLVQCLETELNGVKIKAEPNPTSPYWLDAS